MIYWLCFVKMRWKMLYTIVSKVLMFYVIILIKWIVKEDKACKRIGLLLIQNQEISAFNIMQKKETISIILWTKIETRLSCFQCVPFTRGFVWIVYVYIICWKYIVNYISMTW